MYSLKIVLKLFPWLLSTVLVIVMVIQFQNVPTQEPHRETTIHSTLREKIETLGKLETIKYNFKEITQIEKKGRRDYFNIINWGEDAKAVLVSSGSAVGCIDLTKIQENDIRVEGDTVFIQLPEPELCFYKLNLEETYIYAMETGWRVDAKEFIQEGYRVAENQIKQAALQSGILEDADANARILLKSLLEAISKDVVIFVRSPQSNNIESL